MKYQDRVTVFIDVLGFKDLLDSTIDKNGEEILENVDFILDAYKSIRDVWDLDAKDNGKSYIKVVEKSSKIVTTFSDCIVISFLAKERSEVFYTLLEIKWMIMRLIYRGILCRGAVTYGKLYHTDNVLFGPALVEAYLLESKAALYPRIILARNIIELAAYAKSDHHSSKQEIEFVESLLESDLDGMYYIDYFEKAQDELDDPQYDFPDYIQKLGDKTKKGLMHSTEPKKADLRVKYSWMKEKYNALIDKCHSKSFIGTLRKNGDDELADTYLNLNKIILAG